MRRQLKISSAQRGRTASAKTRATTPIPDRRPRERTRKGQTRLSDRFHGLPSSGTCRKRLTPIRSRSGPRNWKHRFSNVCLSTACWSVRPRADRVARRPRSPRPASGGRDHNDEGRTGTRTAHRPVRPPLDSHRPGRRAAEGDGVARRRRDGGPAVLAARRGAGRREGRGADRDLRCPARSFRR